MAHLHELLDYFDQYEADDILLSLIEEMKIDPDIFGYAARSIVGRAEVKIGLCAGAVFQTGNLMFGRTDQPFGCGDQDYVTDCLKNYKGSVLIISP